MTPPNPTSPRAAAHAEAMTKIWLKLTFGVLAFIITLAFLGGACFLAIHGKSVETVGVVIAAAIGGKGLFWLFDRLAR